MASENVEVVTRQFEAMERGGIDAGAEFWHRDIEWRAVEGALDDVGLIKGRDAMRRYYQDWVDTLEDLRNRIERVVHDSGENLVVVLHHWGRARGSSIPVEGRYSVAYTIRE